MQKAGMNNNKEIKNLVMDTVVGGDLLAADKAIKQVYYAFFSSYHLPINKAYYRFCLSLDKFLLLYEDLLKSTRRLNIVIVLLGLVLGILTPLLKFLPSVVSTILLALIIMAIIFLFSFFTFAAIENFRIRKKIFRELDSLETYITNESPELKELVMFTTQLRKEVYPLPLFQVEKELNIKQRRISEFKQKAFKEWQKVKKQMEEEIQQFRANVKV